MEVVLMKDYGKLGKAMDVTSVKDGYARNFLIPQGIAVPATEGNKNKVAEAKRLEGLREGKKRTDALEIAKKIEQVPCTIPVKVGEEEKIFGSVSAQEIADFLKKEGFNVEKRNVDLPEPIRQLGVYNINISLYKDVTAKLKVWVVKEDNK
jgi:large subunit ribosomal protein L9